MNRFINWSRRYISLIMILIVGFAVYALFLQENSLFRFIESNRTIDSLRTEIKIANDTLLYYQELNSRLSRDPELMEAVVRENFNMVREGEDVYVFETANE